MKNDTETIIDTLADMNKNLYLFHERLNTIERKVTPILSNDYARQSYDEAHRRVEPVIVPLPDKTVNDYFESKYKNNNGGIEYIPIIFLFIGCTVIILVGLFALIKDFT